MYSHRSLLRAPISALSICACALIMTIALWPDASVRALPQPHVQDAGGGSEVDASAAAATEPAQPRLSENFDTAPEKPQWKLTNQLKGREPAIAGGRMVMADGEGNMHSTVAWPRTAEGRFAMTSASFTFSMTPGSHGLSFCLLNTARFGANGPAFELYKQKGLPGVTPAFPDWDEPNLWGSFAIAFDAHNPPSSDPFDEWGNVHERPQHEVSLHHDGRELKNFLCPVNFATGEDVRAALTLRYVTGGAEVTLTLNDTPVLQREFLTHLLPCETRAAFGARGEARGARIELDDVAVQWSDAITAPTRPGLRLTTFNDAWLSKGKGSTKRGEFEVIPPGIDAERIIMTVKLKPMVVRDEWDRYGHVSLIDADGHRWELARLLTPFMMWGAEYEWDVDVTDFRELLAGNAEGFVTLEAHAGANVGKGFSLDLDFTVYRRAAWAAPMPRPLGLARLWHSTINFQKDKRESFPQPLELAVPAGTVRAQSHICITGHGSMEFRPTGRTLTVNGRAIPNHLHTQDCYLNPYRPQYGTWKYDRAGWGPGSIGRVWSEDLSAEAASSDTLTLAYTPEDHEANDWATHIISGHVVFWAE